MAVLDVYGPTSGDSWTMRDAQANIGSAQKKQKISGGFEYSYINDYLLLGPSFTPQLLTDEKFVDTDARSPRDIILPYEDGGLLVTDKNCPRP